MTTFLIIDTIIFCVALILLVAQKYLLNFKDCSIRLNNEKDIQVEGGNNLLNYLNKNKIFIPSACGGKGTCGYCKIKVIRGAGNILPTEEPFIDRAERKLGMRLACQIKVRGKVEISIPDHLLGAEEYEAEVVELSDKTHDVKLLNLKLTSDKTFEFEPGQYVQVKIPGTDEFRAYSVATPPYMKGHIELIVRLVPGGLCSTYIHKALEVGDKITFTGPFGDFFLREADSDIVGIAGGCGMAPIRSIANHLAGLGMPRRFYYFFGARTTKDLFFMEEFTELEKKYPNFKFIPALSEPSPEDKWNGEVGLITEVAERYLDQLDKIEAYLCGPPPMIDAAQILLANKGVKKANIYFDKY